MSLDWKDNYAYEPLFNNEDVLLLLVGQSL